VQLGTQLTRDYVERGLYLKAVAVWKQVLQTDGCSVEAHLWLIALQEQLGLEADAEFQRKLLEKTCQSVPIDSDQLESIRRGLNLGALGLDSGEKQ
jgi:hypothetical protein